MKKIFIIEEVLEEMEKVKDSAYLELEMIEKEIKMLEKAQKCIKIVLNSSKSDVIEQITAIIR